MWLFTIIISSISTFTIDTVLDVQHGIPLNHLLKSFLTFCLSLNRLLIRFAKATSRQHPVKMVHWVGLIIPFAYIGILAGSLATFSSLYRKRKACKASVSVFTLPHHRKLTMLAAKSATLEPWFPPHLQRNIYLSLLHLEPEPGKDKPPTVPDSILKAALLQRATEDIRRILQVRGQKPALSTLLQRGSVGDDLWQRFLRAEKEIEAELRDVVEEVPFSPSPPNSTSQQVHLSNIPFPRQTLFPQTGVKQSFNPPMKSSTTKPSVRASLSSKPKAKPTANGGTRRKQAYSPSS